MSTRLIQNYLLLPVGICVLLMSGCKQVAEFVLPKHINPEVVAQAGKADNWYSYLAERAPGFCLQTNTALIWQDPELYLGYWKGVHPEPPHRVLMEARGHVFILHRHYVWDGCSVGDTRLRDLLPTLRHDALYHALKEGADFSRRDADLAFLRDQRSIGSGSPWFNYACVRLFGGLYNHPGPEKTMLIIPESPKASP